MAPLSTRSLGWWSFTLVMLGVTVLCGGGCEQRTAKAPANATQTEDPKHESFSTGTAAGEAAPGERTAAKTPQDGRSAAELLTQLVATYKKAKTYEDAGELHLLVEGPNGEKQESQQPIPFSVAFERPNKLRIHSLEAMVVADGEYLRASVLPLEGQVLVLPCPEKLTPEFIESDKMLAEAMRGQLGVRLPQLPLLLDEDPIKALAGDGEPKRLEDEAYQGESCTRIAIDGPDGATVLWISPTSGLLVKCEFPPEALKKKFSLAKATIWAEFKGARIDAEIVADAFKFDVPEGAKLLKRFLSQPPEPPSPLLGQKPGDFSFLDFRGGSVTQESLQGKIVVLDLWATWCGWCFEGFPNLEKVYHQYKDNDKVAILAVDTDEATVSDEQVTKAFEKAKLTIPIVRDQRQFSTEVFKMQGLPTMLILGADGTVEDIHVGYDANLAETLPKKLERLLAGESLAKEEIEKYEQARKLYEQQLTDALVTDVRGAANE